MTDSRRLRFEAAPGPDVLARAAALLEEAWAAAPQVPDEARRRLDLALSEVLSNAVEHGTGRVISVDLVLAADAVRVVVEDDGAAAPADGSMPGPAAERGRGLALAAAVLDEWRTERLPGGNRWVLAVGFAGGAGGT